MALHGDLRVNGAPIGAWSAVRLDEPVDAPERTHLYAWDGILDGVSYTGRVAHRYNDGATVLAGKVLSELGAAAAATGRHVPAANVIVPTGDD